MAWGTRLGRAALGVREGAHNKQPNRGTPMCTHTNVAIERVSSSLDLVAVVACIIFVSSRVRFVQQAEGNLRKAIELAAIGNNDNN